MHTVALDPPIVVLTPGGASVVQMVVIDNVPADVDMSQTLSVTVGVSTVDVSTTVTVDNPRPVVSGAAADTAYALAFSAPVQDMSEPTRWTAKITYTPV